MLLICKTGTKINSLPWVTSRQYTKPLTFNYRQRFVSCFVYCLVERADYVLAPGRYFWDFKDFIRWFQAVESFDPSFTVNAKCPLGLHKCYSIWYQLLIRTSIYPWPRATAKLYDWNFGIHKTLTNAINRFKSFI